VTWEKMKPFRIVSSLNFPPFDTNDICLCLIGSRDIRCVLLGHPTEIYKVNRGAIHTELREQN
jgi:hypothetical protein